MDGRGVGAACISWFIQALLMGCVGLEHDSYQHVHWLET